MAPRKLPVPHQPPAPTAPVVVDNCGRTITSVAVAPVIETACGGRVKYAFTYTGCDGTTQTWNYTYTVTKPTWTVPADGTSTVACAASATAPTAPVVVDNCGRTITSVAVAPVIDTACGGRVKYAFTYTGCDGRRKHGPILTQ